MGLHIKGRDHYKVSFEHNVPFVVLELDELYFDSVRWWWPYTSPFLELSTKLGRMWITKRINLLELIAGKHMNFLQGKVSPKWDVIWDKHRAQNERFSFGECSAKLWQSMNYIEVSWMRLTKIVHIVGLRV